MRLLSSISTSWAYAEPGFSFSIETSSSHDAVSRTTALPFKHSSSPETRFMRFRTVSSTFFSFAPDLGQATSRCDGNKASQFNDIALSIPPGWAWRVKHFALIRRRIREEKQKEVDFQRRYRVVKQDVVEILGDIRRCEDWEDKLEYILWGEIRSLIESLPRGLRKKCVARLEDDGILDDGFEL